jgi:hypothetical protein
VSLTGQIPVPWPVRGRGLVAPSHLTRGRTMTIEQLVHLTQHLARYNYRVRAKILLRMESVGKIDWIGIREYQSTLDQSKRDKLERYLCYFQAKESGQ